MAKKPSKKAKLKKVAVGRLNPKATINKPGTRNAGGWSSSGGLSPAGSLAPSKPGSTWVPGTPGVPTPTITPFQTPEDQFREIDFNANQATQLADLDKALNDLQINNDYQKQQLAKAQGQGIQTTDDNAIARGLYTSSIRDAELNDLEATKRVRSGFLDQQFSIAQADAQRRKAQLSDALNKFTLAMNTQKVNNAAEASKGAGPWTTDPTAGYWKPPATNPNKPPASKGAKKPSAPKQPRKQTPGKNQKLVKVAVGRLNPKATINKPGKKNVRGWSTR